MTDGRTKHSQHTHTHTHTQSPSKIKTALWWSSYEGVGVHFCGHHKALQRSQLNAINDTLVKKEHFNSLGFIEALRMTGKQFAGLNMPPAELNFPRHNPGDETGSKEMMLCNDEKAFVQFMDSAGPDQPAHLHRRWGSTFVVHLQNSLQKHAYLNIKKISSPKTENFEIKNWYFSYFCSKHRLWVLVRTASARRF